MLVDAKFAKNYIASIRFFSCLFSGILRIAYVDLKPYEIFNNKISAAEVVYSTYLQK